MTTKILLYHFFFVCYIKTVLITTPHSKKGKINFIATMNSIKIFYSNRRKDYMPLLRYILYHSFVPWIPVFLFTIYFINYIVRFFSDLKTYNLTLSNYFPTIYGLYTLFLWIIPLFIFIITLKLSIYFCCIHKWYKLKKKNHFIIDYIESFPNYCLVNITNTKGEQVQEYIYYNTALKIIIKHNYIILILKSPYKIISIHNFTRHVPFYIPLNGLSKSEHRQLLNWFLQKRDPA